MRSGATAAATTGAGTSADTPGEGPAEAGMRARRAAALRLGRSDGTIGVGAGRRQTGVTTGRGQRGAGPSRRRSRSRNGRGWRRCRLPSQRAGPSLGQSRGSKRRRPPRSWRASVPCRPRGQGCTEGASAETTPRADTILRHALRKGVASSARRGGCDYPHPAVFCGLVARTIHRQHAGLEKGRGGIAGVLGDMRVQGWWVGATRRLAAAPKRLRPKLCQEWYGRARSSLPGETRAGADT